ncbi:MAG: tetratricopeptide repeat protein [Methylocella sp.]
MVRPAAFEHVVKTFGTGLPLDSFEHIAGLSFVTRGDDGFLTIHNAVAQTIREALDPERHRTSIEALFDHYSARMKVNLPRDVTDVAVTALTEAAFLRRAKGIDGFVAWLQAASRIVIDAGRYSSAAQWWRETLEAVEASLGPEHPDTAQSLNNLALLLQNQGDLAGARPLHERALAIREKALGPDHPDTAASLNNLASLLRAQGDFAGARPLHERALPIDEKVLGPEHPDTATSLNNLAFLLRDTGHAREAEPLFRRAIAIGEKTLGLEHPNVATCYSNLACLLRDAGREEESESLFLRAITIGEKALGPDHPLTQRYQSHYARLLMTGRSDQALLLADAALAAHEKALGRKSPIDQGFGLRECRSARRAWPRRRGGGAARPLRPLRRQPMNTILSTSAEQSRGPLIPHARWLYARHGANRNGRAIFAGPAHAMPYRGEMPRDRQDGRLWLACATPYCTRVARACRAS